MKTYYNGPRKGMMYGGGATMRKPMMYGGMAKKNKMQMGGLAEQNRTKPTSPLMTDQKKYNMGMNMGGKLIGGQKKLDKNKNGRIDGQDFKMMKK